MSPISPSKAMAANIEIKARLDDPAGVRQRAAQLSDTPERVLEQEDVFFNVPTGRLKLRLLGADGQLIYYERPDAAGLKRSEYCLADIRNGHALQEVLARAYGIRGVVRKRRSLFMVGATRIHLDEVDGLGSYLELEVVLQNGETDAQGEAIATGLLTQLGIEQRSLVAGAYIDLLEARS